MKDHVLESERLRIEPFAEQHLTERYVRWLTDPEVVRWSEQRYVVHTLASCRAYYESFRGTAHMFFAIVAKDASVGHIGNINVYVETRHGTADIGILLGERAAWGQGFGREAWQRVMNALLDLGTLRKVTGGCVVDNIGMVRLMRACRMVEDGRRERQLVYDGRETDLVYYAAWRKHLNPAGAR